MFRHKGKGRTYTHNLKLASILSGVAGVVNITGVLELHTLTTNVTGHFAFFSEELVLRNYRMAFAYLFLHFVFSVWSVCFKSYYGVGFKIQTTNTLYYTHIPWNNHIIGGEFFSIFTTEWICQVFNSIIVSSTFFYGITECIGNKGIPIGGKNYPPDGFVHGSGNRTVTAVLLQRSARTDTVE